MGKTKKELITVIIPVYKTEKYLKRCLESIISQDYTELDIILIDDGSPDKSGELCDQFSQTDNRIRVIHKSNGGLSSARNAGIESARGEYICFVDSDDFVERDYISVLYNLIKDYQVDLAKINYIEITNDHYSETTKDAKAIIYKGTAVEKAFLKLKVDSACVFMYKKTLIGTTRFPEGKTSEDIPFNFEIFQKACGLAYLPVNKYYYWHNPDSISNGPLDRDMLNYLHFRKMIFEYYQKQGNNELIQLSEALYARAAMGLMTRMSLYGISDDMNMEEYKKIFKEEFQKHSKAFYKDENIPLSRKTMAIFVFKLYPITGLIRKFIRA